MKRSGIILLVICAVGYGMVHAGAGESAGLTLIEPVSAKTAGLAEAGCSLGGDAVSLHYNPAGISGIENQSVSVMYKRGLDEDPVVGISVRMLDVNTGRILWAGSQSETGGCFWFCEDSLSRLTQKVCNALVRRMIKKAY